MLDWCLTVELPQLAKMNRWRLFTNRSIFFELFNPRTVHVNSSAVRLVEKCNFAYDHGNNDNNNNLTIYKPVHFNTID